MSGGWQAANAPAKLAIGVDRLGLDRLRLHRLGLEGMQARPGFFLRPAADLKVEPQQISVHQRSKHGDIVRKQRLAHRGRDLIAIDRARHVLAEVRRELFIVLQVENQLAQPVVGHCMCRSTNRTTRANRSPVFDKSGAWPACRSASIYSSAISPPALR